MAIQCSLAESFDSAAVPILLLDHYFSCQGVGYPQPVLYLDSYFYCQTVGLGLRVDDTFGAPRLHMTIQLRQGFDGSEKTHQCTMQDGWCVAMKHFFGYIPIPCNVLTIYMRSPEQYLEVLVQYIGILWESNQVCNLVCKTRTSQYQLMENLGDTWFTCSPSPT